MWKSVLFARSVSPRVFVRFARARARALAVGQKPTGFKLESRVYVCRLIKLETSHVRLNSARTAPERYYALSLRPSGNNFVLQTFYADKTTKFLDGSLEHKRSFKTTAISLKRLN